MNQTFFASGERNFINVGAPIPIGEKIKVEGRQNWVVKTSQPPSNNQPPIQQSSGPGPSQVHLFGNYKTNFVIYNTQTQFQQNLPPKSTVLHVQRSEKQSSMPNQQIKVHLPAKVIMQTQKINPMKSNENGGKRLIVQNTQYPKQTVMLQKQNKSQVQNAIR